MYPMQEGEPVHLSTHLGRYTGELDLGHFQPPGKKLVRRQIESTSFTKNGPSISWDHLRRDSHTPKWRQDSALKDRISLIGKIGRDLLTFGT